MMTELPQNLIWSTGEDTPSEEYTELVRLLKASTKGIRLRKKVQR